LAKRFQNKVATGRYTLPITVVYAILMLIISGAVTTQHILSLSLLGISTLLMVILNNSNALIRVFSRLVSCSFLFLSVMIPALLDSVRGCVVQTLFILMLLILFKAYQDRQSMEKIFFAFVCIGVISTQFIQILFFVPFLWLLIFTSLQAGSLRVLVASILGLILPYWFWGCYSFYDESYGLILDHILTITDFHYNPEDFSQPTTIISLGFILVTGIFGLLHYITSAYADNIKTRMLYNVIMTMFITSVVFLILQPQHSDYLLRIAIICISPLIAHFFTFTNTRLTNFAFIGTIIAILAITIINTWIF